MDAKEELRMVGHQKRPLFQGRTYRRNFYPPQNTVSVQPRKCPNDSADSTFFPAWHEDEDYWYYYFKNLSGWQHTCPRLDIQQELFRRGRWSNIRWHRERFEADLDVPVLDFCRQPRDLLEDEKTLSPPKRDPHLLTWKRQVCDPRGLYTWTSNGRRLKLWAHEDHYRAPPTFPEQETWVSHPFHSSIAKKCSNVMICEFPQPVAIRGLALRAPTPSHTLLTLLEPDDDNDKGRKRKIQVLSQPTHVPFTKHVQIYAYSITVKQWVLLGVFDANYSCHDWRFVDLNPPQALVYVKRIKVVALKYHLSPEVTVHCYGPDSSSTPNVTLTPTITFSINCLANPRLRLFTTRYGGRYDREYHHSKEPTDFRQIMFEHDREPGLAIKTPTSRRTRRRQRQQLKTERAERQNKVQHVDPHDEST